MNIHDPSHFFIWWLHGFLLQAWRHRNPWISSNWAWLRQTNLDQENQSHSHVLEIYRPHPWKQSKVDTTSHCARDVCNRTTESWHGSVSLWCLQPNTHTHTHTRHSPIPSHCYTPRDWAFSQKRLNEYSQKILQSTEDQPSKVSPSCCLGNELKTHRLHVRLK